MLVLRSKEWSVLHVILVMCAAIPKAIKNVKEKISECPLPELN